MKKLFGWACFGLVTLLACDGTDLNTVEAVGTVNGVRPIYAEETAWDVIKTETARPIENLGKLYYKDQTIYVNERNKGIHVIDNSDPSAPLKTHFIQVLGSEDIAIKGDVLYVDNITDLVALDISNIDDVKELSRVKDLYPDSKKNYPEGYSGFFECVDESKGIVIGWEEAVLDNPACQR